MPRLAHLRDLRGFAGSIDHPTCGDGAPLSVFGFVSDRVFPDPAEFEVLDGRRAHYFAAEFHRLVEEFRIELHAVELKRR